MTKKRPTPAEHWKPTPEEHDYPAAADYLALLYPEQIAGALVEELRGAETIHRKAKDLMRASGLPLLPQTDPEVVRDVKKIARGEQLSPILLVRGRADAGIPLLVADGYHRICASYHLEEDADIPCRLAWRSLESV